MPVESAWGEVLVNRGRATSDTAGNAPVRVRVRRLPDGPEADLSTPVSGYQAALLTHGMVVPVLCDGAGGAPVDLMVDHLDEAIGHYHQQRDPQRFPDWQTAIATLKKEHTRDQLIPHLGIRDALSAAKDAPKFLRGMLRESREAAREIRTEGVSNRPAARVEGVYATDTPGVYDLHVRVMDDGPDGRPATIRAELSDARVQHLSRIPYLEVEVDPADPGNVTLPPA